MRETERKRVCVSQSSLAVTVPFVKISGDELDPFSFVPHLSLTLSSALPPYLSLCHCPFPISISLFISLSKSLLLSPLTVQSKPYYCIAWPKGYCIAHFAAKADTHALNAAGSQSHLVHSRNLLSCLKLQRLHTHRPTPCQPT